MFPTLRRALAATGLFVLLPVAGVRAQLTVDILADEIDSPCVPGDCSLREALADAVEEDIIVFDLPGSPPWTIRLVTALGPLVVDEVVTVEGPGVDLLTVSGDSNADGTGDLRVIRVAPSGAALLREFTVRDGRLTSMADRDGACLINSGDLVLQSMRFQNCRAWSALAVDCSGLRGGEGGAIANPAGSALAIDGVQFVANLAGRGAQDIGSCFVGQPGGRGGAIFNAGDLAVRRSTFTGNVGGVGGAGGTSCGAGGDGGAIATLAPGTLLVEESTFDGNHSGDGGNFGGLNGVDGRGGALFLGADATLNNSTLSANAIGSTTAGTSAKGGGLFVLGGVTRLRNVTIAGNVSSAAGGGVAREGGTLRLRNSIVATNLSTVGDNEDCNTTVPASLVSEGFNLVGVNAGCATSFVGSDQVGTPASPLDPALAPLADNGGDTETHALPIASPAVDAGDPSDCLAWDPSTASDAPMPIDQRNGPRPLDGDGDTVVVCDVGAYERALEQHQLSVALAGSGTGSVTSTPAGIACPSDCAESYFETETVDLAAAADTGSTFTGWSGACTGSGGCSVDMDAERSVTATFEAARTLTVTVVGGGTVASTPAGISCPSDCTEDYANGTSVQLDATPSSGFQFTGWSGACTGTGSCTLSMTQNRAATATFTALRTLSVTVVGGGTVASTPAGISCPSDCTEDYLDGTSVQLDATPSSGFQFTGWSGACTGTGSCTLSMTQNRAATATFTALRTLTVTVVGGGTVASTPAGISCPSDCTEDYLDGTSVQLDATPSSGFQFTGWSGACTGTGSCTLSMTQNRAATATFTALRTLTVTVVGSGSVASTPAGISCPSDCTEDYLDGTSVQLDATPSSGFQFTGWSGACTGTGSCTLSMTQNRAATATFTALRTLTVTVVGGGTVASTPAGISCPSDCTEDYLDGTSVQLDATPSSGFQFTGWSGACTGTGSCTLSMTQNRAATATFTALRTLTVTVVGGGTVASTPAGISCPSDCSEAYLDGTAVQLDATPTGESYFAGWSGACTGTGACNLSMTQNRSVTATFDTMPFLDGFESGDTSRWSATTP